MSQFGVGCYQHLRYDFSRIVAIKVGMQIYQGQPFALTGESGWVGPGSDLHFMTYVSAGRRNSIQTFPPFTQFELNLITANFNPESIR